MLARILFSLVHFASRGGLAASSGETPHRRSLGVRGETYAYWYLRRHGYVLIARNYRSAGDHAELDLVGYDGGILAFIEVKTRTLPPANGQRGAAPGNPSLKKGAMLPEENITEGKHRAMARIARRFLSECRLRKVPYRFDVLAIENRPGSPPIVRLHKAAFSG
jgi:putative endonuclease